MFQNLLSPLKARFDQLTPRSPSATFSGNGLLSPGYESVLSPEDFARDVLIELMRNAVENLKLAEGQDVKNEILGEIERFMHQDPSTRNVFREMDGFLVSMSVLSAIQTQAKAGDATATQPTSSALACAKRVFAVLDQAMKNDQENEEHFRRHVGYESLSLAVRSLLSEPTTLDGMLGLLLAFAMADFSLSGFFITLRTFESIDDSVDQHLKSMQAKLKTVVRPEPLEILWNAILAPHNPSSNTLTSTGPLRYGLYKLFEFLFHVNHRNQGVLSSLSLVHSLFTQFCETRNVPGSPDRERQALQKLLRRLLEMGATTEDTRKILQKAVIPGKDEDRLDPEMLELIRFGMKSRWSEHFSFEDSAALVVHDTTSNCKGLPSTGFTMMLWAYFSSFPEGPAKAVFTVSLPSRALFRLSVRTDGKLEIFSSSQADTEKPYVTTGTVRKNRWVHISLVHYPHRGPNPSVRLFIDGVLHDMLNWQYPKGEASSTRLEYLIGNHDRLHGSGGLKWSLASAYFLSMPIGEDLPRFVHHLGPRYSGNYQDPGLVKFLTYEASTSLNMFLTSVAAKSHANPLSPTAVSPGPMAPSFSISSVLSGISPPTPTQKKPQSPESTYVPATKQSVMQSGLMKIVRSGTGIPDARILFSFTAADCKKGGVGIGQNVPLRGRLAQKAPKVESVRSAKSPYKGFDEEQAGESLWEGEGVETRGNVFIVKAACLDTALWKIGGAAVALRLVQLAQTQHELSRSLGILVDGLKNSWQNSEDMERLRGYELLAGLLRSKAQLINVTGFETLFEFLGINFGSPEHSTVVNVLAYRAIALDFDLWSRAIKEIQRVHLEHFTLLLKTSRYRVFNGKQRLMKLGLVKKVLFALQANWFKGDAEECLINVLQLAAQSNFTTEDAIKPLVSYLAANLHENSAHGAASPYSVISRFEVKSPQENAERVLEMLVSTLSNKTFYVKFIAALPVTRITLLLLGDRPSSFVVLQVLTLLRICMQYTSSFSRKFELVSGWSVLRTVIPSAWAADVNTAAFDLLLARPLSGVENDAAVDRDSCTVVACPQIIPTIIAALQQGLIIVARRAHLSQEDADAAEFSWDMEDTMGALIEKMIDLHSKSSTFREVFRSQQTTQLYIDACKAYNERLKTVPSINLHNTRIVEKLSHLGLALALDNAVSGVQKREILDILQTADNLINPNSPAPVIDPQLIVDTRSVRQRFASARLSIQVGERTVIKTMARMAEWRKTIQASETKRLRKSVLDMREHRRQISRLTEWSNILTSERGLWPHVDTRSWRLDETEGPHRIRMKLEPQDDKPSSSRIDTSAALVRDVIPPDPDTLSVHQTEVPPWAESYEVSSTDMDDKQLTEEVVDDKLRRIRHELEPGDVIEAVTTVARIVGVDSSPGLLIIGKTHIYMLDGVVENDEGEVIDAHDAPKRLLFVPGSIVEMDGPQKAQRWAHYQIATCSDKRFLFRDVALEIYFKDSRSLLLVFLDKKRRSDVDTRISAIINKNNSDPALSTAGPPRTPMFSLMGSRVFSNFRGDDLATATRRWQAREISNFTYLSILNQTSGRTPSDATQYPIFPWVIADYTSSTLDLNAPESYRDLSKPMGALSPERRQAAETRYANLESVGEEPFHYGTHFSSSMIVCHFLIRLAPFTHMFKTLQGGDWDLPDRLFSDMPRAYLSAAQDLRGDVRELVPEFFTCPEFLENYQKLDFGRLQQTGEPIDDVKLPPWAHRDPLLFIVMNRRALESSYVSEHLPQWIDLIWGCKQRDPASLNVFHPLSYEGSVDLDKIQDDLEREATVGIIHNFGQTPRKLFHTPHPERSNHGLHTLPIGTLHGIEEDPHLLTQSERCFKDLGQNAPIHAFVLDSYSEKLLPCTEGTLIVPQYPYEQVEWGLERPELRVVVDQKIVQVIENTSTTCASFADPQNLVTGSSDFTVRLWKLVRGHHSSDLRLSLSNIMRIHTNEVLCVATSRSWSMVVSGSKDGSAALWDLNRGTYIRSIWHRNEAGPEDENYAVNLVAINESTGYIATCSRLKLCLHTVNGRPIATLDLTTEASFSSLVPSISSLAFHERDYSHLGILATGGPDGTITLRTWTADGTPDGKNARWEFLVVRTMKAKIGKNGRPVDITALKFLGECLCHGEETGKSFMWNLPE
ncbi:beach-domain-containing protein [Coprinopsis marcescibilis]|uniref:Beach-domain-containing protein n=1 Tax=Coprinopsis marcescibilis TaxID=230819 RepID=A0A5C3KUF7_COPMA|nr:beach-domain-containing protein [Coprinopsis marcescibilis]